MMTISSSWAKTIGVKDGEDGMLAAVKRVFGFILAVERRFRGDDALMMAAALSYTSLLSLVPLMAIGLAIVAAFPAFEAIRGELQATLVKMLVPEVGQHVRHLIDELIGNAGNLTAIGVLSLVVTAILLLATIEDALNRVFRVHKPRTPTSRLMVYWTVVTLGPILLAASLSVTQWVLALGGQRGVVEGGSALFEAASSLFRFAMLVALFSLLYCAVPNRPVPLWDAVKGGILTALAVALLRIVFHVYVADLKAYQSVYGALAAIPILLFWMYLLWVAVLVGAEFTACLVDAREG
jgi:membrane protein